MSFADDVVPGFVAPPKLESDGTAAEECKVEVKEAGGDAAAKVEPEAGAGAAQAPAGRGKKRKGAGAGRGAAMLRGGYAGFGAPYRMHSPYNAYGMPPGMQPHPGMFPGPPTAHPEHTIDPSLVHTEEEGDPDVPFVCVLCNHNVNDKLLAVQHLASKQHYNKSQEWVKTHPDEDVEEFVKKEGKRVEEEPRWYCNICGSTFVTAEASKTHYEGKKHKEREVKLENGTVKTMTRDQRVLAKKRYWCAVCVNELVGQGQWNTHLASSKHHRKVEMMQASQRYSGWCGGPPPKRGAPGPQWRPPPGFEEGY